MRASGAGTRWNRSSSNRRGNRLRWLLGASAAALAGLLLPAGANAQLYWDTNASAAGAGTPPAGTWGTWGIDPFWNVASDGTGTSGAWVPGSLAVFSAGSDATGPYTIAVSGTQSIGGINVEEGSPTITSGGLGLGSIGGTIDIASGSTLTMQSVLSGAGARLTKSDDGTLVLGTVLNQANTFSAGLTISGGAVEFQGENSGLAGAANALGAAPAAAVADDLQFSNGAILRSFRNNTSSSFAIANRGVTLGAGGGGFDVAMPGAALSYSGIIAGPTGSGAFIKQGPGQLKLTGVNTYTGGTIIKDGILAVSSSSALGAEMGPVSVSGSATLRTTGATANPARPITLDGAGGTIDTDGFNSTFASAAGSGALSKIGAGRLTVSSVRVGDLSLAAGSIAIAPDGTSAGVSVVNSTKIDSGAVLDLSNNKLIDHTTGVGTWDGSAYTGLSGLVASARAGGDWNGSGITSSLASTGGSNLYTLGVARVGDFLQIPDSATATFAGQTVVGSDTVVMYTYGGDANLDGRINIDDYGRIDGNVGKSGSVFGWYNGDFNYDGKINIDDYGIIDGNVGVQGPPIPTLIKASLIGSGHAGVSAVPEPQLLSLLIPGGLVIRRRWRRRAGAG